MKLMGRQSGFIALNASLASRDVNVTLIPEAPWRLSSLLAYLEKRLESRGHCLIAVAEGAEALEVREAREASSSAPPPLLRTPSISSVVSPSASSPAPGAVKKDESGNPVLEDVGVWLKDAIAAHFKAVGKPLNLKYIGEWLSVACSLARSASQPFYAPATPPTTLAPSRLPSLPRRPLLHHPLRPRQRQRLQPVHHARLWLRARRHGRLHGLHRGHCRQPGGVDPHYRCCKSEGEISNTRRQAGERGWCR